MLQLVTQQLLKTAFPGACVLVSAIFTWYCVQYLTSPLRQYPGPFFAGWTNLWRLYQVWTQKYQWNVKELHDKYGPVVRIGPNLLDLDYPELIKTLYSADGKYRKTEFYHNSSAVIDGKITYHLFSMTDEAAHSRMKRPIAKYYSMSSILAFEPDLNEVVDDFCNHLERRFMAGDNKGKECDLGKWIAFCTWDLISSATFSDRFGYMEKGNDFDGTIHIADQVTDYFAMVGQMPFLDSLLDKNPLKRIGPPNLGNVTRISVENLFARLQGKSGKKEPNQRDFLDHFIEAKKANPDMVDEKLITGYLQVNLLAGADTTAITLRAIFNYLLRNPRVFKELEEQVVAADFDRTYPVPYNSARALPYLDAVVREAMRMHPGVGMILERYVPGGGLLLPDGKYVPPGVAVGINPYIVGRNRHIWGGDADEFRPERWLQAADEDDKTFQQRLRKMNAADLTFGGGSRICIGRNLALLEVYKVFATLVSRYEILPADPKSEFVTISTWFPRQSGLVCNLKKRV